MKNYKKLENIEYRTTVWFDLYAWLKKEGYNGWARFVKNRFIFYKYRKIEK